MSCTPRAPQPARPVARVCPAHRPHPGDREPPGRPRPASTGPRPGDRERGQARLRPTPSGPRPGDRERGQATAEYALVMLAAAAIAGLLLAWAASTDGIGRLLDTVLDAIIADAG